MLKCVPLPTLPTLGAAPSILLALARPQVLDCVLGGRPLVCLEFANMEMLVQAPVPWRPKAAALPALHGSAGGDRRHGAAAPTPAPAAA